MSAQRSGTIDAPQAGATDRDEGSARPVGQSGERAARAPSIRWWMTAVVLVGASLTAAGGLLALVHPATLLDAGQQMNAAARIYADYLISRGLALGIALIALLVLRARRPLAELMVLVAFIQLIDGAIDAVTGRAALLPIIATFAVAFLMVASGLFGQPFWRLSNWRDTAGR